MGIDLGKSWFHLIGLDERGTTVLPKKLNRQRLTARAATVQPGCRRRRSASRLAVLGSSLRPPQLLQADGVIPDLGHVANLVAFKLHRIDCDQIADRRGYIFTPGEFALESDSEDRGKSCRLHAVLPERLLWKAIPRTLGLASDEGRYTSLWA